MNVPRWLNRIVPRQKRWNSTISSQQTPNVALCIIASEVLTGKVKDCNTFTLSKFLFDKGIDLCRVETIHDDIDDIAETVKRLSNLVGSNGYVFTSGGIGPTHDDVTYEGVAKAFGKKLQLHQPTLDAMLHSFKQRKQMPVLNTARQRMALLPEDCQVLKTSIWVPVAYIENVFMLPGIPELFEKMLYDVKDHFQGSAIHRQIIRTMKYEGDIAEILTLEQKLNSDVTIGSYVRLAGDQDHFHVQVSIEGRDQNKVQEIAKRIQVAIEGFFP